MTFRFEYRQWPDWEPYFYTEPVTISGNAETAYSVTIPEQGEQTFAVVTMFLDARDVGVTIKDIKIEPKP